MEKSKELMKKAGIYPPLQLVRKKDGGGTQPTGPHKVKVIGEKEVEGTDFNTKKVRKEMRYILEENGEKKQYQVPIEVGDGDLHYLVQRFAEVEEGEEIILEAKSQGGRTFIQLTRLNGTEQTIDDEIPVIEEEMEDPEQY